MRSRPLSNSACSAADASVQYATDFGMMLGQNVDGWAREEWGVPKQFCDKGLFCSRHT